MELDALKLYLMSLIMRLGIFLFSYSFLTILSLDFLIKSFLQKRVYTSNGARRASWELRSPYSCEVDPLEKKFAEDIGDHSKGTLRYLTRWVNR